MAMRPSRIDHLEPNERALEKDRARAADARALESGRISPERLRAENEVFVGPNAARIDLRAARALA